MGILPLPSGASLYDSYAHEIFAFVSSLLSSKPVHISFPSIPHSLCVGRGRLSPLLGGTPRAISFTHFPPPSLLLISVSFISPKVTRIRNHEQPLFSSSFVRRVQPKRLQQ